MVDKDDMITPGAGLRIRLTGIFDFDKLYSDMRDWFDKYHYGFDENENTDKDKPEGREVGIKWSGERKVDDYAKYQIKVAFSMEKLRPVKVGNKKLVEGKLTIRLWATVILDYKDKWQTKPLGNFLFKIYNNYIIKNKINNVYEAQLYHDITELQDLCKEILDLYKNE